MSATNDPRSRDRRSPALPQAPAAVRLPLALPPMLCQALGYTHNARLLALYWRADRTRGGLMVTDGDHANVVSPAAAWRLLVHEHPISPLIFGAYDFGDRQALPYRPAQHWLICDRVHQTLSVSRRDHGRRMLDAQSTPRPIGSPRRPDHQRASELRPLGPIVRAAVRDIDRDRRLVSQLHRWLDRAQRTFEQAA